MTSEQQPIYHSRPIRKLEISPEPVDLVSWYQERLETFGVVKLEDVPVTDGDKWKVNLTENSEVKEIVGAFFIIKGSQVTRLKPDGSAEFQWNQPGIHQVETEMVLPTREGELNIRTSGIVGALRDEIANVLLTLAPEPYARTPKNLLFRTPIQTSATKLADLLKGERDKDPAMYDLLSKVGGSEDIRVLFDSGKIDVFPLPYADANRIDATNYGFALTISDPELRETLKNDGRNRWCTPSEVDEAQIAGLLNGHTAGAISASAAVIRKRQNL